MKVKDLMSTSIFFVTPEANAHEVALQMNKRDSGFIPVCHGDGTLLGVITDRDIVVRAVASSKPIWLAEDIMTRDVITIGPDYSVQKAALVMSSNRLRRLPVVKNNHLVGILSLGDLAKYKLYLCEVGDIYYAMVNDND